MEIGGPQLECSEVGPMLHELRRGRLDPGQRDAVARHLRWCASCRREDEHEALLDRLLTERLPRPGMSAALRNRLEALCSNADAESPEVVRIDASPRKGRTAWSFRRILPALATAAALLVGIGIGGYRRASPDGAPDLVGEAITDHLRVTAAVHPHDVESNDSHNVKPWFEGKIDFAPNVPAGTDALRLRGGSIGYFLDRKAAVVSYALRQHAVTLLAFSAAGLRWPDANRTLNGVPVLTATERGIHVVLWKHGDVGYAAVADVDPVKFWEVAGELARATGDATG